MIKSEIKEKMQKDKKVVFLYEINYNKKIYAKTIKKTENGIEYIYYEIEDDEIKEIADKEIIAYLKANYEIHEGSKIY